MATLAQIVERIRHRLSGNVTPTSAVLVSTISETDLTLQVDDAMGFSRGVIEVGFELMRVNAVDSTTKTLKVAPYGRGYKATVADSHTEGSEVTASPLWPNALLAEEVNGVLTELYPEIYAVRTVETTFPNDARLPVTMPVGAIGVISVWVGDTTTPGAWLQEDRWSFNPDASSTNLTLRVGGHWTPGNPIRVVYAARPGLFDTSTVAALSQSFETVTGLPERCADLLALGVASRLTPFLEVSRLPVAGAEARADAETRPSGSAATTARLLYSEFRARVEQEKAVLAKEHPIRVHRAR